jgi:GPH family glycoside/pentoside/hexuronide:cation symporter
MAERSVSLPPAARERLPLSEKLAFGAGDLGPAIATSVVSFFQLFF